MYKLSNVEDNSKHAVRKGPSKTTDLKLKRQIFNRLAQGNPRNVRETKHKQNSSSLQTHRGKAAQSTVNQRLLD